MLHEGKRRRISAAPFEDRIVHHALVRCIEPRFEALFLPDSYANRVGRGTHRAVLRLQQFCRRHPWVLRLDVRQHFARIDHAILRQLLWRHVPEPGLRWVIDLILNSGTDIHTPDAPPELLPGDDLLALSRPCGLPIGNLTSQFWSNCYLDPLDQFVRRTLRQPAYLRYVDDFALFDTDRARLEDAGHAIRQFLQERLRLRVHESSAQVQPCAAGVPWLGFVVYPQHIRVKGRKVVEATRRLRYWHAQWQDGHIPFAELDARVHGWIAHVAQADSWGLRAHVLGQLPLQTGLAAGLGRPKP